LPPHEPTAKPAPEPAAKPTPSAPREEPESLLRIAEDITTQSWRVATFLCRLLAAALLPVRLHELPHVMAAYLGHIAHRREKKRPTAIATFLKQATAMARAGPAPAAAAGIA
jgi:hypothetical protein